MSTRAERASELGARFWLDDWLVEPSLNRISRGGAAAQVERKAMDVLLYLAGRAGEVVDKRELQDAIWQTEYVADNTVSVRIYELREALQDDAKDPRYIETVPKRGYRLIAAVRFSAVAEPDAGVLAEKPSERPDDRSPYPGLSPFTEADAEDFFGREREIAALWRKIAGRRLLAVVGRPGRARARWCGPGWWPGRRPGGGRWSASRARSRSWRLRGPWRRT